MRRTLTSASLALAIALTLGACFGAPATALSPFAPPAALHRTAGLRR